MDKIAFFRKLNRKISRIPVILAEEIDEELLNNPLILHIQKHPKLRWRDVYKFLMQGSCGWVHLKFIDNKDRVEQYLIQEYSQVGEPLANEELFELIDNQTKFVRLNLRVWKREKGDDSSPIWDLMLKASKKMPQNSEHFLMRWLELIELYEKGVIVINQRRKRKYGRIFHWLNFVLELISDTQEISEIPLVRHSSVFRKNYEPNYRIVHQEDIQDYLS